LATFFGLSAKAAIFKVLDVGSIEVPESSSSKKPKNNSFTILAYVIRNWLIFKTKNVIYDALIYELVRN